MTTRLKPALIVLVAACHEAPVESCPSPRVAGISAERAAPVARPSPFDSVFQAAGTEFDVSPALLKAIGWVETRWQMVDGREEFAGRPPVFGVMALGGTALERGAALAGVSVEAGRRDAAANIRAAAALLRAYAAEAGGDWDAAAARFSGIDLPTGRAAYTRAITQAQGRAGPAAAAAGCPPPNPGGAPDYAPAVWRESPNFDQRPADQTGKLHMVIIHTCESDYASCWSWLVNPASQASAHYVVDEEGGEISQLVREPDRAWHIATLYDCALNRRHDCGRNGVRPSYVDRCRHHARLLRWGLSLGTHTAGGGGRRRLLVPRRRSGLPHARRPLDQRDEPLTAGAVCGDHVHRRHAPDRACGSADRRRDLAHAGYVDVPGRLESGRAAAARRERLGGGGGRRAGAAVAGPGPRAVSSGYCL